MPANIYKLKDGTIVPGTTTICGLLDKGAGITNWAHKIAYESTCENLKKAFNDSTRRLGELRLPDYEQITRWQDVRDSAGAKGTDVHAIIMDYLSGKEVIPPTDDIERRCFEQFLSWWGKQKFKDAPCAKYPDLIMEKPFVSEKLRFGGTPDIIVGKRLIDIKTGGKTLYDRNGKWMRNDWLYQLAGYDILLRENGIKCTEYQILWIPKIDDFDDPIRVDLSGEKKIFKHLLEVWKLRNDKGFDNG